MARNSRFEPPADVRTFAKSVHDMFVALVDEGFTHDQAIRFIAIWFANIPLSDDDNGDK